MRPRAGYVILLAFLAFGGALVVKSAVGDDGKSAKVARPSYRMPAPARIRSVSNVEQGPPLPGLRRRRKSAAPVQVSAPAPPPAPKPRRQAPTEPLNTSPPPVAPAPAPRIVPRPAPRKPAQPKPKPIPFDNSG